MRLSILSKLFSCTSPPITSDNYNNTTNFSSNLMHENIVFPESIITKWNPNSSSHLTSLFSLSPHDESSAFLFAISKLHRAMLFFSSPNSPPPTSSARNHYLIRSQSLMQTAMRVLENEFHHILSSNPHLLDFSSSSDDEIVLSSSNTAIADLRAIVESMMANRYGMECIRIYKLLRKSIFEELLFLLRFDLKLPYSNFHIKSWLAAAQISFSSGFFRASPLQPDLRRIRLRRSQSDRVLLRRRCQ